MKIITDNLDFIKTKKFCSAIRQYEENETESQARRTFLQKTYVIKDYYPKYTKNP